MNRKSQKWTPRFALAALLLTATLSGCAQSGKVPLARSLSGECEFLAQPVPLPPPGHKDLGVLAAQNRIAAVEANARIGKNLECMQRERRAYRDAK